MNKYFFNGVNPTCDLVLYCEGEGVLLIKRSLTSDACPGEWALPGGFIDTSAKKGEEWREGVETPIAAATRELEEETNLKINNKMIRYVGVFEGGGRDPRDNHISWSKSFAFMYRVEKDEFEKIKKEQMAKDDAIDIGWFKLEDISEMKIAFDHKKIIDSAIMQLNKKKKISFK